MDRHKDITHTSGWEEELDASVEAGAWTLAETTSLVPDEGN
jgi:hypothetical protein